MKQLKTIVLYSAGHLGSALVLNKLVDMPELNIQAIIKVSPVPFSKKGIKKIKNNLIQSGWKFSWLLFWQQIVQGLIYSCVNIVPLLKNRITPSWKIAKKNNITIHYCQNINDIKTEEYINLLAPDLIISAYFSQILKKNIISIPKIGILNIHPGWLPAYRGAMCYFWVLKNNALKGGVSIHWIDEGIDTGSILARRYFCLKQGSTQQNVLLLTAIIGSSLLKRIVRKIIKNESLPNTVVNNEESN